MSLKVDGAFIDNLTIDDVAIDEAFVDGVLVFTGPEPGEVERYNLHSEDSGALTGYNFSLYGDLAPKDWLGEFIQSIRVNGSQDLIMEISTLIDLGNLFFNQLSMVHTNNGNSIDVFAADAVYTFNGSICKWVWPSPYSSLGSDADWFVTINQRPLPEIVSDYVFLPGRSENGVYTGYTTPKYQDDIFGDLDPPIFKHATVAAILQNDVDGGFIFGFEDANLAADYWREIQFPGIGLTLLSADANHSPDNQGTFWVWPGIDPGFVTGVNYDMRLKGKDDVLFVSEHLMEAESVKNSNTGIGTLNGLNKTLVPFITPNAEIDPAGYKGEQIAFIFDIDDADNANWEFFIGMGSRDLPQGFWRYMNISGTGVDENLNSIEMLFNEFSDDVIVTSTAWALIPYQAGIVGTEFYDVQIIGDADYNEAFQARAPEIARGPKTVYNIMTGARASNREVGGWSADSFGFITPNDNFRNLKLKAIAVHETNGVFAVVMEGVDKLSTYWHELRIPELEFVIRANDMIFDRVTFKNSLVWYTYDNVPKMLDNTPYTIHIHR